MQTHASSFAAILSRRPGRFDRFLCAMANGGLARAAGLVAALLMLVDGGVKVAASSSDASTSPDYK